MVDNDLYDRLSQYKWFALENGKWGVRAARQITVGKKKQKCSLMHREILCAKDGEIIDHIDRNPLNNQICNLRKVTPSQSNMNRGKSKGKSSKYLGVYKKKWSTGYKWGAQIRFEGKRKHIGYYDTEEEASKAYLKEKAAIDTAYDLLPNE